MAATGTIVAPLLTHVIAPGATPAIAALSAAGALAVGCRFSSLLAKKPDEAPKPETDWEGLVRRLSIVISARDQGVNGHVLNVEHYAVAIAEHLNVAEHERRAIAIAAMLHDIGKLGLPDRILLQDGSLPTAEREVVKMHAACGAAMLNGLTIPDSVQQIIRSHHENWDGSGYPDRLAGQHIPLSARILSVADVYDALTSARAYRGAWTQQRAMEYIRAQAGKQFDPLIVDALTAVLLGESRTGAPGAQPPVARSESADVRVLPGGRRELGLPAITVAALHTVYSAGLESSLLYDLDRTLNGEMPTGEMLSNAAKAMQRCLSTPMCAIVTRDPESDTLRPHWPAGSNGFPIWQRELMAVAQHVVQSRESWCGNFTLQGQLEGLSSGTTRPGVMEGIVIPIEREEEILGVIAIVRGTASTSAMQLDITLRHVASRIASALDSSLLFDRARHHAFVDPMTGLYNIRYFKSYLDQLCETGPAMADSAGAVNGETSESAYQPFHANGLNGRNGNGHHAAGADTENGCRQAGEGADRQVSSKRLAEQPLTRRLVRREQTEGAPARLSGPRGRTGASEEAPRFALLCLDLNNFKPVNDRFGHLEGDRVLRDIADRLRQTAPAGAVVARYGGDEFLIALPGHDQADAAKAIAHLHAGVESYDCGLADRIGATIRISVSIGMSLFPMDGTDGATLLSIADQRMFRAKANRKAGAGETARAA